MDKFISELLKQIQKSENANLITILIFLLGILFTILGFLIKYFYDKLTKDIEIKFVPNKFTSYLKSTRFWQKNLFIKDNKNYYKTNNFIKFESNIEKYPTISIVSKNKKITSSLQKYYKAKITDYKLIYEQVFAVKPIIQDFYSYKKEDITVFNQDLIVEIAHFGFDEVSDFEITIVDKIFQSYFETTPKAVGTIKTGQKQRIVLQEAGKLINKDCEELEFENIELNISYKVGQRKFSHNYILQNKFACGIIKFNKKNGFYSVLPGGMGGSTGSFEMQNLYICHNDFQKSKSKKYIIEINRELSGNQNSGSSEELNFQIIPDKPCQFQIDLSLLDEDQKPCSNIIKRKYKTLFPKN